MNKIFLIPGLGADSRLYSHIEAIEGYEMIAVEWIKPIDTDTLSAYAQKLINKYNISENSVVIGTSLGGMIGVEIAKLIPVKKLILISSIKTIDEAPSYFKLFKNIPLYKLAAGDMIHWLGVLIRPVFGRLSARNLALFKDMLKRGSPKFIKWAMGAVLHWNNKIIPPNLYHINGNKDWVFDHRLIKDATIVEGGTHLMVMTKARQVNRFIKLVLLEQ